MEVRKLSSVTFNGVEIRYNDTRRDEAGVFNRIHIAFQPSEPVMNALEWDALPDSIPSGKLTGRLAATHVILTPTDKALRQHELQFAVSEVRDFGFNSKIGDEGQILKRTITATIVTSEKIAAHIENWLSIVGHASAVAKIGYAQQQQLPGTEVVDDKQTVIEMRKPEEAEEETELVSANELNAMGSGRERKRRTRANSSQFTDHAAPDAAERDALEQQINQSLQ